MAVSSISFHIKSNDAVIRMQRQAVCDQVLSYLGQHFQMPSECSVLCLIDDEDFFDLKSEYGPANRGGFSPIRGQSLWLIPHYFRNLVTESDGVSRPLRYLFDCVIYVHGSTCESEIGLCLTLAHELRHFLQYANERDIWAADKLLRNLPAPFDKQFTVWWDFPIEKDARQVAKQVAEHIFGIDAVRRYIIGKIEQRVTDQDAQDWSFVLSLSSSTPSEVVGETKLLIAKNKPQLKQVQTTLQGNPDLSGLDLDSCEWDL
jgi:hypothetical protein